MSSYGLAAFLHKMMIKSKTAPPRSGNVPFCALCAAVYLRLLSCPFCL